MRTLEEAIKHAEYIAGKYSGAVSVCWSANDNKQLSAWLRELQERRKVPEIVRCSECEHFRKEPDGEMWCGVSKGHRIDKDFFCGDAERRTE